MCDATIQVGERVVLAAVLAGHGVDLSDLAHVLNRGGGPCLNRSGFIGDCFA